MGRPLRKDTIEAMELVASGKTLSKQVGYNKYHTVEDEDEIVRLAEVEDLDNGDVVLVLHDGENDYPVIKIMKHLFQTTNGAYVYTLDAEGKPVFDREDISVNFDPTPTLTISATPADATVVLTADGYEQKGNKITVATGTEVAIAVSKEGYDSYEANKVVEENETLEIALERTVAELPAVSAKLADETVEATIVHEPVAETYYEGDVVTFSATYTDAEEHNYAGSEEVTLPHAEPVVITLALVEEPAEEPAGE